MFFKNPQCKKIIQMGNKIFTFVCLILILFFVTKVFFISLVSPTPYFTAHILVWYTKTTSLS